MPFRAIRLAHPGFAIARKFLACTDLLLAQPPCRHRAGAD